VSSVVIYLGIRMGPREVLFNYLSFLRAIVLYILRTIMQENLTFKRILTYDDLTRVAAGDSKEPLVSVQQYASSILAVYNKPDMLRYTGDTILVRDEVAKKLGAVNEVLEKSLGLRLKVVYGYRHPEVQERYFYNRKTQLRTENPDLNDDELNRLTHNFVAVPDVAGHPTGGAVDLTIVNAAGEELDMGNVIADYRDPEIIKTFAATSKEQAANRKILHDAMVAQGFAPFYGEWWHFSYGDREWAAFYGKKEALYGAIRLSNL